MSEELKAHDRVALMLGRALIQLEAQSDTIREQAKALQAKSAPAPDAPVEDVSLDELTDAMGR